MTQPIGFSALEQRRAALQQQFSNSAGYASAFVRVKTTGWGEYLLPDAYTFGTAFAERPSVAHAIAIEGDDLVKGRFPRVTAGVRKWQLDEKGMYIGAWLFVLVETLGVQDRSIFALPQAEGVTIGVVTIPQPLPKDPGYEIAHDFTFTGTAIKIVPTTILEH